MTTPLDVLLYLGAAKKKLLHVFLSHVVLQWFIEHALFVEWIHDIINRSSFINMSFPLNWNLVLLNGHKPKCFPQENQDFLGKNSLGKQSLPSSNRQFH